MPITVIIGGQFGSEGKGKVAHFFTQEKSVQTVIRIGGTNSGHTVIDRTGYPVIFRQLPTAAILPGVVCVLGAGSYVNPNILLEEIARINLSSDQLIIDPNAMLITEGDIFNEKCGSLRESIGSTLSGTGAAVQTRISRESWVKLAKDEECLKKYIKPVVSILREKLLKEERIIIEGTQGFGLSLLHSKYYPYVTSRDTIAAAFISEVGLSPLDVDEIVMVLRAFPIRVKGNSGPIPQETNWKTVTNRSGSDKTIVEYTSVSKTLRRIAYFDPYIVQKAINVNQPTSIVLNHLDYVDASCKDRNTPTEKISSFLKRVELNIGRQIDYMGFGPKSMVKCI